MTELQNNPEGELLHLNQWRGAGGRRAPHKPLLLLMALAELARAGSSALVWLEMHEDLARLIAEFGQPSTRATAKTAAYPFTRLQNDKVWSLSAEVAPDDDKALHTLNPTGKLRADIEQALIKRGTIAAIARQVAEQEFAPSLVPDVLLAVGFCPESPAPADVHPAPRSRSREWVRAVLAAWDRQCAVCGFDGRFGDSSVGIEAAHIQWFTKGGPDTLDNGLALCRLHHVLLDKGALGLEITGKIIVSAKYSAGSDAGRQLYQFHGVRLNPRPGTPLPADEYVAWHRGTVFGEPPIAG